MKTPNISKTIATLAVASGLALGANSSLAQEINTNTKKVSNSVSRVLKEDNPSQIEYKLNFETEEARETFDKAIEKVMGKFWYKLNLEKNQLSGNEVTGKVIREYKVEKTSLSLEQIDELYKQYIEEIKGIEVPNKEFDEIMSKLEDLIKLENDPKKIINILESIIDDRILLELIEKKIEDEDGNDRLLIIYDYLRYNYLRGEFLEKINLVIVNTKTGKIIPKEEIDKLENLKSWKDIVFRAVIKR